MKKTKNIFDSVMFNSLCNDETLGSVLKFVCDKHMYQKTQGYDKNAKSCKNTHTDIF